MIKKLNIQLEDLDWMLAATSTSETTQVELEFRIYEVEVGRSGLQLLLRFLLVEVSEVSMLMMVEKWQLTSQFHYNH